MPYRPVIYTRALVFFRELFHVLAYTPTYLARHVQHGDRRRHELESSSDEADSRHRHGGRVVPGRSTGHGSQPIDDARLTAVLRADDKHAGRMSRSHGAALNGEPAAGRRAKLAAASPISPAAAAASDSFAGAAARPSLTTTVAIETTSGWHDNVTRDPAEMRIPSDARRPGTPSVYCPPRTSVTPAVTMWPFDAAAYLDRPRRLRNA